MLLLADSFFLLLTASILLFHQIALSSAFLLSTDQRRFNTHSKSKNKNIPSTTNTIMEGTVNYRPNLIYRGGRVHPASGSGKQQQRSNPAGPSSSSSAPSALPFRRSLASCFLPFCRTCPPPSVATSTTDLMFCSVVGNAAADDSALLSSFVSDDSDSEASSSTTEGQRQKQQKQRASLQSTLPKKAAGWRSQLLQFSNIASFLCVLDCTILPIVTVILPLFGLVALSSSQMKWLHQAGHAVALGFVLPVGLLATVTNYLYSHRTLWIASLGWLGLVLVVGANAGCSLVPHGVGGAVGHVLHEALHYLHHGIAHRLANLTGCALLLFSNYLSHRRAHAAATTAGSSSSCAFHGPECNGKH